MVTSTAVLLEVLDGLAQQQLRYLSPILQKSITYPKLEVVDMNRMLFSAAWELYEKRTDKDWGITDCSSFLIMNGRKMMDVLTYDIHFAQAGFRPSFREEP